MTLKDALKTIKVGYLANVSNLKQASDEAMIVMVNEAITSLHTSFNIRVEQATILVPANRHNFSISRDDPNVIMSSFKKVANIELNLDKTQSKKDILKSNKNSISLLTNEFYDNSIFDKKDYEVLQILFVEDNKDRVYDINTKNVFALDQTTLYFPNVKEGDIIYVTYKPKPRLHENLNEELDIPDTLLGVLYAFVALKTISSIDINSQFLPQIVSTYNQRMQEAINNQPVLPDSLSETLNRYKGFV